MTKEKKEEKISAEEAAQVLQEENQKKIQAFVEEYNVLIRKHGVQLVAKAAVNQDGTLGGRMEVGPFSPPKEA